MCFNCYSAKKYILRLYFTGCITLYISGFMHSVTIVHGVQKEKMDKCIIYNSWNTASAQQMSCAFKI